jgi:FMN phosphatase YigB (HAD superfamily)
MDYEKERKILTDVDGVLLDWEPAFTAWMGERGYTPVNPEVYKQSVRYNIEQEFADSLVQTFNESAWMGYLKPLRDSVNVLDKFSASHWHFECITSLSTDHWAGELRRTNLNRWFGSTVRRVQCIATGADKDDILKEYEPGHWWIEDKPENCEAGLRAGHKPILIDHPFNQKYNNPNVIRVKDWEEIYNIITKSA